MKTPLRKKTAKPKQAFISWFEIPAFNVERASLFYNDIFDIEMEIEQSNGYSIAYFPTGAGPSGAIVAGDGCTPCNIGPLIYLNGGDDLNGVLSRIDNAGGRVIMGKTLISEEAGFFALFIDTEGNRMALHSKG